MASDTTANLLTNAAATGVGKRWDGGRGVFVLKSGTIGGATVALQWSPDGGTTWLNVDRAGDTFVTFTAVGSAGGFELPPCQVRAAVTGGAGISGLYAQVIGTRVGA